MRDRGYTYGTHWAPHDIRVRELGSARSRLETAATLGIKFQTVPNVSLEDGIHAVRMLVRHKTPGSPSRCWTTFALLSHAGRTELDDLTLGCVV